MGTSKITIEQPNIIVFIPSLTVGAWKKLIFRGGFIIFLIGSAAWLSGCYEIQQRSGFESCCPDAFRVEEVRLNASFTQLRKSQEKLERPDTLDVFVEMRDQFGDPIKATGKFRFEIYMYKQKASTDRRGQRFPLKGLQWVDLTDPVLNQEHWDKITRCYHFTLQLSELPGEIEQLVLQVTYLNNSDYRLEDMLTLPFPDSPPARTAFNLLR